MTVAVDNGLALNSAIEAKLATIQEGATANATNAQLRDRTTHTGTQLAATVSDFAPSVRSTALTGLSTATATSVTATDTVLAAAGKLQGQASANATAIADKLNTADAPAAVRDTPLTGLSTASATPITSTDSVLSAAGKLQAQIATKLNTADAPATVRDTALTGLSTATATAVTAGDTVLVAAGKLQGQATDNAALLPPFFDTAWYKSGLYYDAVYPYYTTIEPTTGDAGVVYFNKRKILDDATFNELSINVTAAASGTVFYGIYASGANGLPTTLLASGSASSATTGVKSTAATLALTKGQVVWDAYLNTGAAASVTAFQPIFQDGTGSPIANGNVMLTRTSQTSLPADASVGGAFSLLTTSRIPRVALRAA